MKKRMMPFLLAAFLVCVLAGCASKGLRPYSVMADETTFTVNPENSTIFDGENTYQYEISETAAGYKVKILYPNGGSYWWDVQSTGLIVGGHDENFNADTFASEGTLVSALEKELPKGKASKSIPLILLLAGLGILGLVWPHAVWYLTVRWQCRNGEPSDIALKWIRFSGVIALIAAVIFLFV